MKKLMIISTTALGLAIAPQHAKAENPVEDILSGLKVAKKIYKASRPVLIAGGKLAKKGYRKFKSRHGSIAEEGEPYVNPIRAAAEAGYVREETPVKWGKQEMGASSLESSDEERDSPAPRLHSISLPASAYHRMAHDGNDPEDIFER